MSRSVSRQELKYVGNFVQAQIKFMPRLSRQVSLLSSLELFQGPNQIYGSQRVIFQKEVISGCRPLSSFSPQLSSGLHQPNASVVSRQARQDRKAAPRQLQGDLGLFKSNFRIIIIFALPIPTCDSELLLICETSYTQSTSATVTPRTPSLPVRILFSGNLPLLYLITIFSLSLLDRPKALKQNLDAIESSNRLPCRKEKHITRLLERDPLRPTGSQRW
jgi:hypothetical protein